MDNLPPPVPTPDPLESEQATNGPNSVVFLLRGMILLVLSWVLINILFSTDGCPAPSSARLQATRHVVSQIKAAVRAYEAHHGALPDSLDILCAPDASHPPLLRREFLSDSWVRPFRYRILSTNTIAFEVRSSGPDKIMDTADDLTN